MVVGKHLPFCCAPARPLPVQPPCRALCALCPLVPLCPRCPVPPVPAPPVPCAPCAPICPAGQAADGSKLADLDLGYNEIKDDGACALAQVRGQAQEALGGRERGAGGAARHADTDTDTPRR